MFYAQRGTFVPASSYPQAKGELDLNLIDLVKSQAEASVEEVAAAVSRVDVSERKAEPQVEPEAQACAAEPEPEPIVDASAAPVEKEEHVVEEEHVKEKEEVCYSK